MKGRYFIFDCMGRIVGNPDGYATFKGANRQQNMPTSKAFRQIYAAFESRPDKDDNHLCSIKYRE